MMIRTLSIIIVVSLLGSCNKENMRLSSDDYLIFGHYYGECIGESCVEIFKLEKDNLFEDARDYYPNQIDFYNGDYRILANQQFESVNDLMEYFPVELLHETKKVIGQPDAGDWGGLYIEYSTRATRKFWLIDKMKSNVPAKYHSFVDKVNEKIANLQ